MEHRAYGGAVLLEAEQPLPRRPQGVLVAGSAGAGKTTLAARLSQMLDVPHVEIDGLFHGPMWSQRETFIDEVKAFSARTAWITEWQYDAVRPLLAERADLLVWLDLSRATVMRQVVRRTIHRRLRRQVLWNGNIEPSLWTIFTDPEHIVRWAWSTQHRTAHRIAALQADHPELVIVRLQDHRCVRRWVDGALHQAISSIDPI